MKGFYWYSFVAVMSTTFGMVMLFTNEVMSHSFFMANKLSFIFHFVFLNVFIYRVLKNAVIKRLFIFIFSLFLFVILYILLKTLVDKNSYVVNTITNFFLVVSCFFYYYDFFESVPVKKLFYESSFWVVGGIFICMTVTVPLNAIRGFFPRESSDEINLYMGAIASFSYGIMHLSFVKAYLCSTKLQEIA